jgi:hypothetical protein
VTLWTVGCHRSKCKGREMQLVMIAGLELPIWLSKQWMQP